MQYWYNERNWIEHMHDMQLVLFFDARKHIYAQLISSFEYSTVGFDSCVWKARGESNDGEENMISLN